MLCSSKEVSSMKKAEKQNCEEDREIGEIKKMMLLFVFPVHLSSRAAADKYEREFPNIIAN